MRRALAAVTIMGKCAERVLPRGEKTMNREMDMAEVSDGKLYGLDDMVKADCAGCEGCHACCTGMGTSVVLDPFDAYRMTTGTGKTFEALLAGPLELNVVDGIILPNLKMSGEEETCSFLDANGRCTIHAYRPGICRLFPLGRIYEDGGFRYFLQVYECAKETRAKVKVRKWIDMPEPKRYDAFVCTWHYFLKDLERVIGKDTSGQAAKTISLYLIRQFYLSPYKKEEDFYPQFEERLTGAKRALAGFLAM